MSDSSVGRDCRAEHVEVMSPSADVHDPGDAAGSAGLASSGVWKAADERAKRLIDLMLASTMLLITSPVWPLIALAIKLEDRGQVFYRQLRWGQDGRRFRTFKFRSMGQRASEDLEVRPAEVGDSRVTRVGQVLRASGLDELPQILNILRGEMSFVGPRPLAVGEILEEDEEGIRTVEDVPGFFDRLSARPGLTSLATIYLPKDCDAEKKFRYDLAYVRRRNLWMDLRLIATSFWISIRGKWESRDHKI